MYKSFILIVLLLFSVGTYGQNTIEIKPLCEMNTQRSKTALTHWLNQKKWNEIFPHRFGEQNRFVHPNSSDFYSFRNFVRAARYFPTFISGSAVIQKRELAAFLANIAQETSGGWDNAPGGYFKWGLYYLEEKQNAVKNLYADTTQKNYPPVAGVNYHGRGPKQLSWNYNYGQFSEAWYGNKDTLLLHPERLIEDPVLSFASAIWFWMTAQFPKPSCHDIMTDKWKPTETDLQKNRVPGFGTTVNVINGGVECGLKSELPTTQHRYAYYQYFCRYFHVKPGENITCTNQTPFGQ